ncbi:uncharacterized protein [Macrobrachium rosenbergii]|uniref:uncharacterized protein n=1 Tax=Macrobrachium rosenbergii TaxID=79674 RepID=UPI0034D46D92
MERSRARDMAGPGGSPLLGNSQPTQNVTTPRRDYSQIYCHTCKKYGHSTNFKDCPGEKLAAIVTVSTTHPSSLGPPANLPGPTMSPGPHKSLSGADIHSSPVVEPQPVPTPGLWSASPSPVIEPTPKPDSGSIQILQTWMLRTLGPEAAYIFPNPVPEPALVPVPAPDANLPSGDPSRAPLSSTSLAPIPVSS